MTEYYFDKEGADRAVNFIETFVRHVKGELTGQKIKLEEWQKKEVVEPIFGWKEKDTGYRKYRTAYIEIPRKNGKSSLGAAIALYMLFADSERGAEIYSCAGDRAQAAIIFGIAKKMIEFDPELSKRSELFRSSIVNASKGNTYKVLSSESRLQHGHNAHAIFFDELHTQPNRELWDAMITSTGARTQPLVMAITTAGSSKLDGNICWENHDYAIKVKEGTIEDPAFLSVIYSADEDDDITDEKTWRKANPNFDVSIRRDYIEREAKKANEMASYENTFKRLHLNIWTSTETKWISDTAWMGNDGKLDMEFLKGKECWGGLDLASTRDLSSLVLLFPMEDETFHVLPFFWIPDQTVYDRTMRDNVDYLTWKKEGLLLTTPGDVQDYAFIRKKINDLADIYNIKSIAFDRWNSSQLVNNLVEDGAAMAPFGQGYASMSAPTKELEKMILRKQIIHGGNPVLRWQLSNVQLQEDPAGNIKINKAKSSEKVDGMVALVMSLGDWMTDTDTGTSVYDERGILTI